MEERPWPPPCPPNTNFRFFIFIFLSHLTTSQIFRNAKFGVIMNKTGNVQWNVLKIGFAKSAKINPSCFHLCLEGTIPKPASSPFGNNFRAWINQIQIQFQKSLICFWFQVIFYIWPATIHHRWRWWRAKCPHSWILTLYWAARRPEFQKSWFKFQEIAFLHKKYAPCGGRSQKELVHKASALGLYAPRCLK